MLKGRVVRSVLTRRSETKCPLKQIECPRVKEEERLKECWRPSINKGDLSSSDQQCFMDLPGVTSAESWHHSLDGRELRTDTVHVRFIYYIYYHCGRSMILTPLILPSGYVSEDAYVIVDNNNRGLNVSSMCHTVTHALKLDSGTLGRVI